MHMIKVLMDFCNNFLCMQVMTDPDAPSPSEPSMRELIHWSLFLSLFSSHNLSIFQLDPRFFSFLFPPSLFFFLYLYFDMNLLVFMFPFFLGLWLTSLEEQIQNEVYIRFASHNFFFLLLLCAWVYIIILFFSLIMMLIG